MHYFDQRGVYRVYAASLDQATWRFWRDAATPDVSQRFNGSFSDDGNTITGRGQLSRDGKTWEGDLDLNYRRLVCARARDNEVGRSLCARVRE